MATDYEEIYNSGRSRFRDFDFLLYDDDTKNEILFGHMKSAVADFQDTCQRDLTLSNNFVGSFSETLSNDEIEILGLGLAYYWCSEQALNSELFKNIPSTKDFSYSSPATLLSSITSLRDSLEKRFTKKLRIYGYRHGGISKLGTRVV
ncbi:MAG: hypothetical protein RR365_01020 [Bacteroides sp.]